MIHLSNNDTYDTLMPNNDTLIGIDTRIMIHLSNNDALIE